MKTTATALWIALALCLPSASAFADFVCNTNSGDARNFIGRGKTQADAQLEAFNTCNGAGSTSKRACQVNTQCEEEGRGFGFPRPHRPEGHRPGWHRPSPQPSVGIVECSTSGGDSRTFIGRGNTQQEAQTQAFDTCNSAGRTSKNRCNRNMSCSYRRSSFL